MSWPPVGIENSIMCVLFCLMHGQARSDEFCQLLGGALDGGAQVLIFILTFAVFGASGISRPFPKVT